MYLYRRKEKSQMNDVNDELKEFEESLEGLSIEEMRDLLKEIRKSRVEKVTKRKTPVDNALTKKLLTIEELFSDDDEFII